MKSTETPSSMEKRLNQVGWRFVFLASILVVVFNLYPMFEAVRMSFMSGKGNHLAFSGFLNFRRMLGDETLKKAFLIRSCIW